MRGHQSCFSSGADSVSGYQQGPTLELDRLPNAAGVQLLRSLGVEGNASELRLAVGLVKGHALTLTCWQLHKRGL